MAFTIQHTPITAALDLAAKAGKGESEWRRFAAAQDQRRISLAAQSQATSARNSEMQMALQRENMLRAESAQKETDARRNMELQLNIRKQAQQEKNYERIATQRLESDGRLKQAEARAQAHLDLSREKEERIAKGQEMSQKRTIAARADKQQKSHLDVLEKQKKLLLQRIESMVDPITASMSSLDQWQASDPSKQPQLDMFKVQLEQVSGKEWNLQNAIAREYGLAPLGEDRPMPAEEEEVPPVTASQVSNPTSAALDPGMTGSIQKAIDAGMPFGQFIQNIVMPPGTTPAQAQRFGAELQRVWRDRELRNRQVQGQVSDADANRLRLAGKAWG